MKSDTLAGREFPCWCCRGRRGAAAEEKSRGSGFSREAAGLRRALALAFIRACASSA